jgi:hypothetical protein
VPGVIEVMLPAHAAFTRMLKSLELELAPSQRGAIAALEAFAIPRFEQLHEALKASAQGSVNARKRLGLERAVAQIEPELEAATRLLDLLGDALWAPRSALRIRELLGELKVADTDTAAIAVSVSGDMDAAELHSPSSVATGLLWIAINLAAVGDRSAGVSLGFETTETGFLARVRPGTDGARQVRVARSPVIPPTEPVARAAAERIACAMELESGAGIVAIRCHATESVG